jgi:histone H3/H4
MKQAGRGASGRGGPHVQREAEAARLAGVDVSKSRLSAPAGGSGTEVVKKKRFRPGARALMEIRKYQKCTKPILRMIPFTRLVRDRGNVVAKEKFGVSSSVWDGLRYKRVALEVLREMMELWMVRLLEDALLCALHRKVKGVQTKDLLLARRMREKPTYQWQYEQVEYTRGKGNKKK